MNLPLTTCRALRLHQHRPSILNSTTPFHITRRGLEYTVYPGGREPPPKRSTNTKQQQPQRSWNPSYRFVDKCRIRAQAGAGGRGSLSMEKLSRKRRIQPNGGHGGSGGSVVLLVDEKSTDETAVALGTIPRHVAAVGGAPGASHDCNGAAGKNLIVRIPPGVIVRRILEFGEIYDAETGLVTREDDADGEEDAEVPSFWWDDELEDDERTKGKKDENEDGDFEEEDAQQEFERAARMGTKNRGEKPKHPSYYDTLDMVQDFNNDDDEEDDEMDRLPYGGREVVTLADLDKPGSYLVVARGGRGGIGTSIFTNNKGRLPPPAFIQFKAKPQEGELAHLELELKLIADVGLVGFPNAGKSSLLRALSRATPAVAPYPFTTLHPLIGCVEYRDGLRIRVADIPGLIDGASEGRGKGHEFLRHVERTKALLYMVDVAGVDFRDPIRDLEVLAAELASYGDGSLMERQALVVGNKIDLLHVDKEAEMKAKLQDTATGLGLQLHEDILMISAGVSGSGLGPLSGALRSIVEATEEMATINPPSEPAGAEGARRESILSQ